MLTAAPVSENDHATKPSAPMHLSAWSASAATPALEAEADAFAERARTSGAGGRWGGAPPAPPPGRPRSTPAVQHKCGCPGACECDREDEPVQLQADPTADAGATSTLVSLAATALAPLVVEDDSEPAEGQVRRRDFLARIQETITRTADEELARVGRSTTDCPYLQHWLGRVQTYSASRLERGVVLVARPTTRTVDGYLSGVAGAVRERVGTWIASGRVDSPESVDQALAGTEGGAAIQSKPRPGAGRLPDGASTPRGLLSQLGPGQAFAGAARQRLESGFGTSFDGVRVHTDAGSGDLVRQRGALALTVGQHIVFGPGQFQPGTPSGMALLAHELAHTIQQQGGGVVSAAPEHEDDADLAAAGALGVLPGRKPQRRSGLSLQACTPTEKRCPPGMGWQRAAGGTMGAGSFGCACVYRCLPEPMPPSPHPMLCPASGCRQVNYEVVGDNYVFQRNGQVQTVPVRDRAAENATTRGWGASSTPLTSQHMCLCPGVNIENEDLNEGSHMTPIEGDLTDIAGPLAEGAVARRSGGSYQPPRLPDDPPAIVRPRDEPTGPRPRTDDQPSGTRPRTTEEPPSGTRPRTDEQPTRPRTGADETPGTTRRPGAPDDPVRPGTPGADEAAALSRLRPGDAPPVETGGVTVVRTMRSPDGLHEIKLLSDGSLVRCSAYCRRLRAFYRELVEGPNRTQEDINLARELEDVTRRAGSRTASVQEQATRDAAALEPRLRVRASSLLAAELRLPPDSYQGLLHLYTMADLRARTELVQQLARKPDHVRTAFNDAMGRLDDNGRIDLVHELDLNRRASVSNAEFETTVTETRAILTRHGGRITGELAARVRRRAAGEREQAGAELQLAEDIVGGRTPFAAAQAVEGIPDPGTGRAADYRVRLPAPWSDGFAEVKTVGVPAAGQAPRPISEEALRRNLGSALGQLRATAGPADTNNLIRLDGRYAGRSTLTSDGLRQLVAGELQQRIRDGVSTPVRWVEVIFNDAGGQQQRVTLEVQGAGASLRVVISGAGR